MDLKELGKEINFINESKGWEVIRPNQWENPDKIPCKLALIHSEVSEALEAFRNGDSENFKEELADIIIRTISLADGLEIDLDTAVLDKVEKNRARAYKHGGKIV